MKSGKASKKRRALDCGSNSMIGSGLTVEARKARRTRIFNESFEEFNGTSGRHLPSPSFVLLQFART